MERFLLLLFILTTATVHAVPAEDFNPLSQPVTMEPYPHEVLNTNEQLESELTEQTTHKKSITELMNEQTEVIRRIISTHKSPDPDYPVVTKQEADVKHKIPPVPEITEQETIETLKIKCEHLAKLQQNNMKVQVMAQEDEREDVVTERDSQSLVAVNLNEVSSTKASYYVTPKPPLVYDYYQGFQQQKKHHQGFYVVNNNNNHNSKDRISTSASYHQKPSTSISAVPPISAQASSINQNYIKMEPVVLQRTMLTNGNMLFYWYRPLRNTQNAELGGYNYQNHQENLINGHGTRYGQYGGYPLHPLRRKEEIASTTTSTTTEISPQIEVDYGSQESDNNVYRSQYRFILPMAYKAPMSTDAEPSPNQFDQYAYLPEYLRPTLMNVQMPYMPTYHMIKAIAVPQPDRGEVLEVDGKQKYNQGS